jgi:hypothetical protein
LWRGVEEPVPNVAEGTPAVLIFPMPLGAFQPPNIENRIYCGTHIIAPVIAGRRKSGGAKNLFWFSSEKK